MEIPLDRYPETRKRLQAELLSGLAHLFAILEDSHEHLLDEPQTEYPDDIDLEILSCEQDWEDLIAIIMALLEPSRQGDLLNLEKIETVTAARRARLAAAKAEQLTREGTGLAIRRTQRGRPGIVLKTAISRIEDDLSSGRLSVLELERQGGVKKIEGEYSLSHSVAVEARKAVLTRLRSGPASENVGDSVVQFPTLKSQVQ